MNAPLRDVDRGMKALLARLAQRKRVRVGILADAPKESREGASTTLTLLEVAAVHEFGAPAAGIPQRSFLRAGVDELAPELATLRAALVARVLAGALTLDAALDQLGAFVAGRLQARIAAGIAPANAPATVERKGSSTPLIDSGQLRGAITWTVEDAP